MQRSIAKNLSKNRYRQMELLGRSLDEKAIGKFSDNLSVENYRRPNEVSTRNVSRNQIFANKIIRSPCDVFINHRGVDTKRTVASLLYDHLYRLDIRPFLDNKNMKPGDKLFDKINDAVKRCKIGVLVFSPRYCESYWCLHELALMMELKKKVIPIFCDVKPSELGVVGNDEIPVKEIERFKMAIEEAKYTVGLTFDSQKGNWADVVTNAANIVMQSLMEVDQDDEKHIY